MLREERIVLRVELSNILYCLDTIEQWGVSDTPQDQTVCCALGLDAAYNADN